MNPLITKVKNPVIPFLLLSVLYLVIWDLFIYPVVLPNSFQEWIINRNGAISHWILSLIYGAITFSSDNLYINNVFCVHIGIPCNGVETMGIISCIILAFRAPWFHKLWFLLANYLVIFSLNTIRISALAILRYEQQWSFDINHKYIFNLFLYGTLLVLFAVWSRKTILKPPSLIQL